MKWQFKQRLERRRKAFLAGTEFRIPKRCQPPRAHRWLEKVPGTGDPPEIAAEVGVTPRSVQRVLKHVREQLERQAVGAELE
jgi:hypothetical protein